MSELLDFEVSYFFPYPKTFIGVWHVGICNSIDSGLKALVREIRRRGEILLEDPQIVDYLGEELEYRDAEEIIYVILFRSLPKLEYLEYRGEQVDKNTKKR